MIPHTTWSLRAHTPGTEPAEVAASILRSRTLTRGGSLPLLPDLPRAAARIRAAIERGEPIAIHGDYDADGITAARIVAEAITRQGGHVCSLTAARRAEGYGLSGKACTRIEASRPKVVVLCDLGTSSARAVNYLVDLPADVICLDHHEPPSPFVWPGLALLNPKTDRGADLLVSACSASLAYLFACHLTNETLPELAELAALGILADMADLASELNRGIVRYGLSALRYTTRPGLVWLMEQNNLREIDLRGDDVSWNLIPILNAPGRVGDTEHAMAALGADTEAADAAWQCHQANQERKHLTAVALEVADRQLAELADSPFPVLWSPDWHKGVIGLVSSALCRRLGRPVGVGAVVDDEVTLSFRCPPGHSVLSLCQGIPELKNAGGHERAGGARAAFSDMPAIRDALAGKIGLAASQKPTLDIDRELPLSAHTETSITVVDNMLAPYGQGWPRPLYVATGLEVVSATKISKGQKLVFKQGERTHAALSFERTDFAKGQMVDVVYSAEVSHWRGSPEVKLVVRDGRLRE